MRTVVCFVLIFFVLKAIPSFAQTQKADSLKNNIAKAGSDKDRISAIFTFCEQGYTLHPDTLRYYAEQAKQLAEKTGNRGNIVRALYYESGALTTKGLIDSSLHVADESLRMMASGEDDPVTRGGLYNQKGRCYIRMTRYREAIGMGLQTIELGQKIKNVMMQVKGTTLVGWTHLEMGQYNEALAWHLKALRLLQDTMMMRSYAILFANLATNYNNIGQTDSAFYYINIGISYAREDQNLMALSNCLAIESELFVKAGTPQYSEPVLKEVIDIRKKIGDPFYMASDMAQLGYYYAHYGQPEKGIAISNEGIAIAKKYHLDAKLLFLYSSLADNYKALGDYKNYAAILDTIIDFKDNVTLKNSADAIAEMQAKYDVQQKENLILQQKLSIRSKNFLFYGSLIVLLFAVVLAWLLFKDYRRKEKLKMEKMQASEKILSAIAVTKAEEQERKRIAADLHDNLGAYAAAIASNVDQVSNGQNGETPLKELKINAQSIVSQLNDTIWVLKKDNLSLTAISDRMKVFIQQISASYPQVNIDVTEHIDSDILFPSAQAFNLYRIIKEAVVNAVRHSGSKNVRVFFVSSKSWNVTVCDEGKGISGQDKKMGGGNGIINMKKRSKESGWTISWQKNEPQGTTVIIEPTTN